MEATGFWLAWAARLLAGIAIAVVTVGAVNIAIEGGFSWYVAIAVALPIDAFIFCFYKAIASIIDEYR